MINKVLKKSMLTLFLSFLLLLFTSCSFSKKLSKMDENDKIMKKGNEIRDALMNNPDSEKFSLLFCEKVRETKDFQEQVSAVYTFISQNLEAKSPYENRSLHPLSNQDRGIEKKGLDVVDWYVTKEQFFYNLIIPNHNDVNTWYKCNYSFTYYWQIKDEDSKEEGLHYLTLKLLNTTEQVTIGTNEFTSEK